MTEAVQPLVVAIWCGVNLIGSESLGRASAKHRAEYPVKVPGPKPQRRRRYPLRYARDNDTTKMNGKTL